MPPVTRKRSGSILVPTRVKFIKRQKKRRNVTVKKRKSYRKKSKKSYRRKKMYKPRRKLSQQGVVESFETGISTTTGATDCQWIGHTTFVQDKIRLHVLRLILKKLMMKAGYTIRNFLDNVSGYSQTDNTLNFYIWYKKDAEAATSSSYLYASGSTSTTFEAVVLSWHTLLVALAQPIDQIVFTEATLSSDTGLSEKQEARIDLVGASISLKTLSNLKLQNATVSATGNEADQVDRIPVTGKRYFGYGTGTISNRTTATEASFYCSAANGICLKTGTIQAGTSEMPTKGYFNNVSLITPVNLGPGQIIRSTLSESKYYKLDKIMQLCMIGEGQSIKRLYNGKFALIGMEHLIKHKSSVNAIVVNGEHSWTCIGSLSLKKTSETDRVVYSGTYITY